MFQSKNNPTVLCPRIKGTDELHAFYGGDESWLDRNTAYISGCAPTCAANVMTVCADNNPEYQKNLGITIDDRHFISQEDYTKLLHGAYKDLKINEIPIYNNHYDNKPRKINRKFAASTGIDLFKFARGVKKFAKRHDIQLEPSLMFTRNCAYYRGLAFIKLALSNGYPVVMLTTLNAFEYTMFDRPYMQKPHLATMKLHYITITDVRDSAIKDEPDIIITNQGKTGRISYKVLYESWHSTKAFCSGLCYFIPAKDKKKKNK